MKSLILALVVLCAGAAQAETTTRIFVNMNENPQRLRQGNEPEMSGPQGHIRLNLETKDTKSAKRYAVRNCSYRNTVLIIEKEKDGFFGHRSSDKRQAANGLGALHSDLYMNYFYYFVEGGNDDVIGRNAEVMSRVDANGNIDLQDIVSSSSDESLKAMAAEMISTIKAMCDKQ